MRRLRRGVTMVEQVVATLILSLVGGMAMYGLITIGTTWNRVMTVNEVVATNRQGMDLFSEKLRNAQNCAVSGHARERSVLASASATSVEFFHDDITCATVRYYLSGTNLRRVSGGIDTIAVRNVSGLTLTYLKTSQYYDTFVSTANPSSPIFSSTSNDESRQLAGVQVTLTTTQDGQSITSTSLVRFRNSPRKTRVDGL